MAGFVAYREGDVFKLELRDGDLLGGELEEYPGPKWTLLEDDQPIMCFGLLPAEGGVCTVWSFFSDAARGHGKQIVAYAREVFDGAFDVMSCHRLQTVVRKDDEEYQRFVGLFGFEREGLLRKATPDQQDILLYARVN